MSSKRDGTTGLQQRKPGSSPSKATASSSISRTTLLLTAALGLTSIALAATMKVPAFRFLLPFLPLALSNNGGGNSGVGYTGLPGAGLDGSNDGIKEYTLSADGIKATFIGYGARMTHMYVNDRQGNPRDIVVGYDDPAEYVAETKPSYFGPVVGRFANRIKNGTFEIANQEYHVPNNEHDGLNALHGGNVGYDARNWTMVQCNSSSITFSLFDPSGFQGFPGAVVTYATYTLSSPARLTSRMVSMSLDQKTPIMLANHIYWNLGSFSKPTVLDDTLHLPYAKRTVGTDGIQIPTGAIDSVVYPWQSPPVPLNFTSPKRIGDGSEYSQQCGTGCTGIDNAFIFDRPAYYSSDDSLEPYALKWNSPDTGITMTMRTNQGGLQIYDCLGQAGTVSVKASQRGNGVETVQKYGCLVIETQDWIDAINQPGWGRDDRVFSGPTDAPVVNFATYDFTVE